MTSNDSLSMMSRIIVSQTKYWVRVIKRASDFYCSGVIGTCCRHLTVQLSVKRGNLRTNCLRTGQLSVKRLIHGRPTRAGNKNGPKRAREWVRRHDRHKQSYRLLPIGMEITLPRQPLWDGLKNERTLHKDFEVRKNQYICPIR